MPKVKGLETRNNATIKTEGLNSALFVISKYRKH
jgi:hypothetical protein